MILRKRQEWTENKKLNVLKTFQGKIKPAASTTVWRITFSAVSSKNSKKRQELGNKLEEKTKQNTWTLAKICGQYIELTRKLHNYLICRLLSSQARKKDFLLLKLNQKRHEIKTEFLAHALLPAQTQECSPGLRKYFAETYFGLS